MGQRGLFFPHRLCSNEGNRQACKHRTVSLSTRIKSRDVASDVKSANLMKEAVGNLNDDEGEEFEEIRFDTQTREEEDEEEIRYVGKEKKMSFMIIFATIFMSLIRDLSKTFFFASRKKIQSRHFILQATI